MWDQAKRFDRQEQENRWTGLRTVVDELMKRARLERVGVVLHYRLRVTGDGAMDGESVEYVRRTCDLIGELEEVGIDRVRVVASPEGLVEENCQRLKARMEG